MPERLEWNKRSLQATHSGEVHPLSHIEPGGRAISARDRKSDPLANIQSVARTSRDVVLPPSLQRPGRISKPNQRLQMDAFLEPAKNFLRPRPNQEAPIDDFDRYMRTLGGYEDALQRANIRGYVNNQATKKFVKLYGELGLTDRERIV